MTDLCQSCESERLLSINGKVSDLCYAETWDGRESDGYVPDNIGIGGGDYLEFVYCIDCGQIQGKFCISSDEIDEVFGEELIEPIERNATADAHRETFTRLHEKAQTDQEMTRGEMEIYIRLHEHYANEINDL